MKIGNLVFDNNVFLAPMAGVTDISFRGLCKEMGCGLVYTEMVSSKALYYESDNVIELKVEKDGFIVKGEDSAEFLEEKLKILGLTDRETEEFIIYWLPKLEANKYNYIRFATREEIDANMPLTITPEPDTTIRVLMEYKGLENPIEVEEQKLETILNNNNLVLNRLAVLW